MQESHHSRIRFLVAIFAAGLAVCVQAAQDSPRPTPLAQQEPEQEGRLLSEHLVETLSRENIPGGIVVIELCNPIRIDSRGALPKGTLRSKLDQIQRSVTEPLQVKETGGALNIIATSQKVPVLQANVGGLHITDWKNASLTVQELLSAPAVQAALKAEGLRLAPASPGWSSLGSSGQSPVAKESRVLPQHLSLIDALNELAVSLRRGVWLYREMGCAADGEVAWLRLQFVSR